MGDYYRHARTIANVSQRAMHELARAEAWLARELFGPPRRRKLADGSQIERDILYLPPDAEKRLRADPRRIMALLEKAATRGWRLADAALDTLERVGRALDGSFAADPANRRRLMQILGSTAAIDRTIADMHECGLLELFIPEFEQVRAMVRIDHYQPLHRRRAHDQVARRGPADSQRRNRPRHAAGPHRRPDRTLGTCSASPCSSTTSARASAAATPSAAARSPSAIGDRLGLPPEDVDTVRFLVLSHLKLSHAAQTPRPVRPERGAPLGRRNRLARPPQTAFPAHRLRLMAVSPRCYND
jgi:[protein-PII] uridylyltransferase